MVGAMRIGSVRGIPIRIHLTFLIVLPFLALAFGRVYTDATRLAEVPAGELHGSPFLWGLIVALALFASVLVHELAHSLYALAKGGRVHAITLTLIGGVSELAEQPKRGRDEAVMALVGPLTSLLLGGAFYLLFRALSGTSSFDLKFVVFQLASLNIVLGIFNLLPAFPMDGGRVLRGLLAERWGALRATRLAVTAGKAFAALFAIVGFLSTNVLLMVIAFFVYMGAEAEGQGVLVKAFLGRIRVRDLMSSRPEPVEASASVYELAERMLRSRQLAFPVVESGVVVGAVSLDDVRKVPAEERMRVRVADIVRRVPPVEASDDASRGLRALTEAHAPLVPVVDAGAFVGVLTQLDLSRALQLHGLEETQHPGRERRPFFRRAEQRG
jgi:Zn-dependent protease/CBS domain-containing protein